MITNWNNKQIVVDNTTYSLSTSSTSISKTSNTKFYILNGNIPSNTNFVVDKKTLILNHKYILKSNNENILISDGETTSNAIIFTNYSNIIISIVAQKNVEYSNLSIGLNLFDLTAMGLDSITSVEQFNALFPNRFYDYDNGSLKNSYFTSLTCGNSVLNSIGEIGKWDKLVRSSELPNITTDKPSIKVIQGQTRAYQEGDINSDTMVTDGVSYTRVKLDTPTYTPTDYNMDYLANGDTEVIDNTNAIYDALPITKINYVVKQ